MRLNKITTAIAALTLFTIGYVNAENIKLHYIPVGKTAVAIDGTSRFNRALYGAHSGFRVDCSDYPEFGIYLPNMGGNLKFDLPSGKCVATYTPGRMDYIQGGIKVETQVGRVYDIAIWKLTNTTPKPLCVGMRFGGASGRRFSREGDLGVDKPDCFDFKRENCIGNVYSNSGDCTTLEFGTKDRKKIFLVTDAKSVKITETPSLEGVYDIAPGKSVFFALVPSSSSVPSYSDLPSILADAEKNRSRLASSIDFDTPEAWLNPLGGALAIASDAIWSGEAWLHGSIGWRTPHLGWRGAYVGDAIGRHDRALTHFYTYAHNQITDIPPSLTHPQQDSVLNLARSRKVWGTPMYSNGYICRRPGKKDEMSHYDMNLVYVDAMLRHFRHTGDTAAMRSLFPVIKRHLDWEKRNFDPDNDHLYDGYCCIWASDALYYNAGQVTHSSAYNAFANRLTAQVARQINEDPIPFDKEADAIEKAIEQNLWMPYKGSWAEFRDVMGLKRLHESPAVWTIYHAVDSEITDPLKAYAATSYIDREIPHIPVYINGSDTLFTISTTNWKPYSWSINNVAIAEVMHTALAYWQAGRSEEAFKLMKAVAYDNMYSGASPLNFGQISQYDAARGECYRDFADPIGVWSRALTEGLFGIKPDLLSFEKSVTITPGFPSSWEHASVNLSDIAYTFSRKDNIASYNIENRYPGKPDIILTIPGKNVTKVLVNGKEVEWTSVKDAIGFPRIEINAGALLTANIVVTYDAQRDIVATGISRSEGPIIFKEYTDGSLNWWEPSYLARETEPFKFGDFTQVNPKACRTVNISDFFNAEVPDIFKNEYLSPRPDVTTLQIPKQGIGDWCHPQETAEIDDTGLRELIKKKNGIFRTDTGISFQMPYKGLNVAYTSLWDNFPDSIQIPMSGKGSHIYLAMAGSTNHMQWNIPNGKIRVYYSDGSSDDFHLVNPVSWAPIEQDFYTDKYAFSQPNNLPLPMRFSLSDGSQSRTLGDDKGINGVEPRRIPGGAGILLDLPVNPEKKLARISLSSLSNDVIIGLMGLTIQNP